MVSFGQNLLNIFRLYRWASVLNILGLAVAFAAFYIIARQCWYEYRFDKHYPDHELIYRLEYAGTDNFVRPDLVLRLSASPYVQASGMCYMFPSEVQVYKTDVSADCCMGDAMRIDKGYTEVFGFEWVSGNISGFDLSDKNIIIPASMAQKLFGTVSVAGKQVKIDSQFDEEDSFYHVVAVYKDFPENSTIFNGVYVALNHFMEDTWNNGGFRGYVKVDRNEHVKAVEKAMGVSVDPNNPYGGEKNVELFPMDDIYFHSDTENRFDNGTSRGDIKYTWFLFSFGCLIVLVAMVNFSNFSMALAPVRIKSFNTQKVLGASVGSLRVQYWMECIAISVIAFLFSLLIVQLAKIAGLSELFIIDISLSNGWNILGFCALLAVLIGWIVGIYPSLYMTSVPAALALKGSFRLSPKGLVLRNLLIAFQFVVASVFLIISMFYYLQNRYMLSSSLEFTKKGVVVVPVGYKNSEVLADVETRLKNYAGASYVFSTDNLLLGNRYQGWGRENKFLNVIVVTQDIVPGLEIKIIEGRTFNPDEVSGKMLINESARRKYDFRIGDKWNGYEIIGVIPDIKIFSFYKSSSTPLALLVGDEAGEDRRFYMCMKLKPGVKEEDAIAYCQKVVEPLESTSKIHVRTLDEVAEELYEEDINRMSLFSLFCGLSILIAVMGVFGLIVFELQSRRKEIAIRKINGATALSIVGLFNKTYLRILFFCFVVSIPVSLYWIQPWLEGYVYHIPLYGWVFVVAFLILLFITFTIVSLQCWRTANENPVESLKNE